MCARVIRLYWECSVQKLIQLLNNPEDVIDVEVNLTDGILLLPFSLAGADNHHVADIKDVMRWIL